VNSTLRHSTNVVDMLWFRIGLLHTQLRKHSVFPCWIQALPQA